MADRLLPIDIHRDVDDELASHVEMRRQELVARGMTPAEARETALRRFGDLPAIARECREINRRAVRARRRTSMWMDLRQDLTYALRLLARAPGFTAVAVCTLALGIGATTAIFSLANWALLRPVPGVERPRDLQQIWVGTWNSPTSFRPGRLSYPNLLDIAPRLTTVDLAGLQTATLNVAAGSEAARTVPAEFVTASYFSLLGVRFGAGRPFTAEEDRPSGAEHVTVVSERFSKMVFGSGSGAAGQILQINGRPFTVIGIAEEAFGGTSRLGGPLIWLPGASYPVVNHMPTLRYDDRAQGGYYQLVGRLRAAATWPQVEAELRTMSAWLLSVHPKENAKFDTVAFHVMAPLGENALGGSQMKTTLWLMLSASALVLLIACSNVASLLLIRGIGRRGEVAVRQALGAARVRLLRQHLTEGVVLWLFGGAIGLLLVWTLLQLVDGGVLLGLRGPVGTVPLDWGVVAFAVTLSLAVGIVFSVVPALRLCESSPRRP
jgi:putative ABC transport system permease protein